MVDIEVRYSGESSWHYYGSCASYDDPIEWVKELNATLPDKTVEFRIRK